MVAAVQGFAVLINFRDLSKLRMHVVDMDCELHCCFNSAANAGPKPSSGVTALIYFVTEKLCKSKTLQVQNIFNAYVLFSVH